MDNEAITDPIDKIGEETAPEATDATETVESDSGEGDQPRSDDGRFASPDEKSPEGKADEAAPETPEGEAGAGEAEVVAEPTPYTYRADTRDYDVTGATVGPDGVLSIPADSIPSVTQLLASGRHWTDSRPQELAAIQQQVEAAKAEGEAATQRANALTDQFSQLSNMSPDELVEWAEGFKQNWPSIQAKASEAAAEAKHQSDQARLQQYEENEQVRTLEPQVSSDLSGYMALEVDFKDGKANNPLYAGLDLETLNDVHARLVQDWRSNGLLLTDKSLPWKFGEGTPNLNLQMMRRELEYAVSLRRQQDKEVQKTAQAKKDNKAELEEGKAPPAVSTNKGPSPATTDVKRFKLPKGVDPTSEEATELADAYLQDLEV